VLQCVAVCCSLLQCVAVCCSVLQCVAVCCSVLQCVAVCCSVLLLYVYDIFKKGCCVVYVTSCAGFRLKYELYCAYDICGVSTGLGCRVYG